METVQNFAEHNHDYFVQFVTVFTKINDVINEHFTVYSTELCNLADVKLFMKYFPCK